MNIVRHKPDLSDVVMPLIRFMASGDLSWANRAEVTAAIGACERQWRSMQEEAAYLNQGVGQQRIQEEPAKGGLRGKPEPGDLDYVADTGANDAKG